MHHLELYLSDESVLKVLRYQAEQDDNPTLVFSYRSYEEELTELLNAELRADADRPYRQGEYL